MQYKPVSVHHTATKTRTWFNQGTNWANDASRSLRIGCWFWHWFAISSMGLEVRHGGPQWREGGRDAASFSLGGRAHKSGGLLWCARAMLWVFEWGPTPSWAWYILLSTLARPNQKKLSPFSKITWQYVETGEWFSLLSRERERLISVKKKTQ